jgi:ferredoxin-NADP reductase
VGLSGSVVGKPSAAGTVTLTVVAKVIAADGVCRLRLEAPGRTRLADWAPGAHIDVGLPNGLTRQYSLCGDRRDSTGYEVAVLRERDGRGGSAFVHDELRVGDRVEIGGPRNNFALAPAEQYLCIAGGIGITPLLPMIDAAETIGVPWTLLYGGRSRSSMAFVAELEEHAERVMVRPQDEFGLLDLAEAVRSVPDETKVYCCGPASLLDAITATCAHLPAGRLRTERFEARAQQPPVRTSPYEVVLASTGTVLTLDPSASVLGAVAAAGIPVLASCRQGVCGTCETGVLAGVPDHRDSLLSEDERRRGACFYPCVSRSASDRLVLDL